MNRKIGLALILIMAASTVTVFAVKPAKAQPIPTPSVPQFTVQLVKTSDVPEIYWLSPGPNLTISISPDNNTNYTIELTVKNQPFIAPFTENGQIMALSYDVRVKEDYSENWTDVYALTEFYPVPTNSTYTIIPFPLEVSGIQTYTIESCYYGAYDSTLRGVSAGDRINFQVETQIGYAHRDPVPLSPWYFEGQTSGWSGTQTITIPEGAPSSPNPAQSPSSTSTPNSTPTPSVPELSWLVIVPLLLSVPPVAGVLRRRKQVKKI